MSSADGSSIPGGVGGADGGDASNDNGANGKKPGHGKKASSAPRQSAAVLLQLKVIRKALERLMTERNQLDRVKLHLQDSSEDLEREIARVSKMRDIAQEASNFQHGRPHESVMQFLSALTSRLDDGSPIPPGPSSAITDGTSSSPTGLQNITNDFLFGIHSNDSAIPMMDDSGAAGFDGLDYVNHLISDLGIETFPHEMVQQVVRDIKIEDTSGDEDNY